MASEKYLDPGVPDLLPLAELCGGPMAPGRFLKLAIPIAEALAELHHQNLTHENLTPSTILIDEKSGEVRFSAPGSASASELAPAYMSPEQTGRLNLPLDQRSDLYSLGVTFYQMLTGSLPCLAEDLLEWVHCHIAHPPRPMRELASEIPQPLADIVMRLLAKDPQERYQTAAGVRWDLERALAEWERKGEISPFPLAQRDIPDRLLIPQKLYGRQGDLAALAEAFARMADSGEAELLLVTGYAGVGKTSLVYALRDPNLLGDGYFISGKFDQYQRNVPYSTIAEAFRELMRYILAESEERIARWREEIQAAVGINGELLVEIVPELELVIGKQPKLPELSAAEAENRFKLFFTRFVQVFARREHPLVIFVDDLQWPDLASLKLLGEVVTQTLYLLVIGAYRDNEVTPSHPLMLELARIEERGARIGTIALAPLSLEELGRLIAETLRTEPAEASALAGLVHDKTGGNPFFSIQFLKTLYDEGAVWFDKEELRWKWEIAAIREKGYSDNVAVLMAAKLRRLPTGTQQMMKLGACLGNRFDLRTLAISAEIPQQEARRELSAAVRERLLLQTNGNYAFLHDRIQEAAYALIPEQERPGLHLRIGKLMLAAFGEAERAERVLDLVSQLNRGADLVCSDPEREQVAELNLVAARWAKAATAYVAARHYAETGRGVLGGDAWERRPDLAYSLELVQGECEFLTGELEAAQQRLSDLYGRDLDPVQSAAVTCLLIDLFATRDRSDFSVQAALQYLSHADVEWSPHPAEPEVQREFAELWEYLAGREIGELIDLPLLTDPNWRAVMDVLARMMPPAIFTDGNLFSLVVCRSVKLSLQHGNSDGSCVSYVWLAMILGYRFGNYDASFRFAKLGVDLMEQRGLDRYQARVYLEYSHVVNPWKIPMRDGPPLVSRALDLAMQRGDLTFTAYSSCNLVSALLAAGRPLSEVNEEGENRLEFAKKVRYRMIADIIAGQLGLIRQLRGLTPAFESFNSPEFDQSAFEQHLEHDPAMAVARSWYWVRKLEGCFFAGDYQGAEQAAEKIEAVIWTIVSHLEVVVYHFFAALTCCARYPEGSDGNRGRVLEEARRHRDKLLQWEELAPFNFSDRSALVAAEVARIEGRELDAELFYEKALAAAREQGFPANEALAAELASRFYRLRGFATIADIYLCGAASAYRRWGAHGKIRQLEKQHPTLRQRTVRGLTGYIGEIDTITVVKASQAISREIVLSRLLDTLMRIVLENSGARKGLLVLLHRDELSIAAEATVEKEQVEVVGVPPQPLERLLPLSVANFVRRTGENIILDDATAHNTFSADEYFKTNRPFSVLCIPLCRLSETVGMLYLENDLVRGAFTAERIGILEALAAQAAISLENARLYEDYRELSESLERRVKEAVEELDQKNRMLVMQSRQAIMGEMLGNIAHQWRQPLNTLALLAQELKITQKFDTLTKEALDANVKKTMEIIQHMSKTIDDFRYFFRPEKEKEHFRLLTVLEKALSLLQGTFQAYNIKIEIVANGDPILAGYPNEYSQVVLNILNNAKDAFISRKTEQPKVVITVASAGEKSVVTIADNAGGIRPEIMDKIFDLYFTTKGPEQGTGVGLFMSKSIIEKNMHGALSVRNTGEGAEFRIEV
jgi:predicted ATPase/signal transduction histidine kinase